MELPKNFRDLAPLGLNVIASAEFSEAELQAIIAKYPHDKFIVVDLRLESNIGNNTIKPNETPIDWAIEQQVVKKYGFKYQRFPIKDYHQPDSQQYEEIINFITKLNDNQKIYVHCKAGLGRTTNFLAMYDIIKNGKKLSFDQILERQHKIGGIDLREVNAESMNDANIVFEKLMLLRQLYFRITKHC